MRGTVVGLLLVLGVAGGGGGGGGGSGSGSSGTTATLLYSPAGDNITETPFPSDDFFDAGVLRGFTTAQLQNGNFLNQLAIAGKTGYATTTSIRIPFSGRRLANDPARLLRAVRLYDVSGGTATAVAIGEIEITTNDALRLRPSVPFAPGRTYGVVVLDGVLRTDRGGRVLASADYAAVIAGGDPLTDAGFAKVVAADPDIDGREDTIVYFQLTTANDTAEALYVRDAVNGAAPVIVGSTPTTISAPGQIAVAAAQVLANGTAQVAAFYSAAGVSALPQTGINRIVAGLIVTPAFVSSFVTNAATLGANPVLLFTNGTILSPGTPAPLSATNPAVLNATNPFRPLPFIAFFPAAGANVPVVVGIHGFSRRKEDMLAVASAVCAGGMALIAIDIYQHGQRQNPFDPTNPAAGITVPEGNFATKIDAGVEALAPGTGFPDPFLNATFIARSRDKIRQTYADILSLIRLLALARDSDAASIDLDANGAEDDYTDIRLLGQSLGGIIGTVVTSISPDVSSAFLSVPGGGLQALIRESIEVSDDTNLLLDLTATATGFGLVAGRTDITSFSTSPEREVSDIVGETITGAIDPLAYAPFLVPGTLRGGDMPDVLYQFVQGDRVVPNSASARLARAAGSGAAVADDFPHLVSGLNPLSTGDLFEMGLPRRNVDVLGFRRSGVVQSTGSHGILLDFANPFGTLEAQAQARSFLARLPPFDVP